MWERVVTGRAMTIINWTNWFQTHDKFRPLADAMFLQALERGESDEHCVEQTYQPGEEIITQGRPANLLYFIGKGSVKISVLGPDREPVSIGTLWERDFFGELSLLDDNHRPRSATVQANEHCILLEVEAEIFRKALHQHPDVFSEMLLTLSERLRQLAERLSEVAYQDVDNKVQLIGAKLDAELKAVNASLTASQKVFDQTTTWANEVLASSERFWTRVTWAGTVVGAGFAVLVGIAGYIGFQSFDQIRIKAQEVEEAHKKVTDQSAQIEATLGEITALRDSLSSGTALIILPELFKKISSYESDYEARTARKLFGPVLRSRDLELSRKVFIELRDNIRKKIVFLPSPSELDGGAENFRYYRVILSEAIDNQDSRTISTRNIAISQYLYLITLLLDFQLKKYDEEFVAFTDYVSAQNPVLSPKDQEEFSSERFIGDLKANANIDKITRRLITEKMRLAWRELVNN